MDVGGYVLKAILGGGGFGTVFLGERGGRPYALKLVALEGLAFWGERELLMLARVKHPNAVRLLGHWHWPDQAPRFLVVIMEYVEGRQLDVWARTENPCARQVLRLVRGVARALAAVHRAKALHRDVKEANIVVREADGEAVLVDFGVGTYEGTSHIDEGALPPGTHAYLSPEAWHFHREHALDSEARCVSTPLDDLYALGVVLHWLLTDRRPFQMTDEDGVDAVISQSPVAPHVRNPRVPPELGELCLRLLEKRPEDRPDAEALCAALEVLLTREGAEWDVPLCDVHGVHNVTTRPGPDADEEAAWLNEVREDVPPRRGRRPPRQWEDSEPPPPPRPSAEATTPALLPAMAVAAPLVRVPLELASVSTVPSDAGVGAPGRRRWGAAVLALLALGLTVVGLRGAGFSSRVAGSRAPLAVSSAVRTLEPVHVFLGVEDGAGGKRKVAPPWKAPDADEAADRLDSAPTSAATDSRAVTPEEPASVKTSASKQPKPFATGHGAARKVVGVATVCAALSGCASAPVRPPPPPEPCPAGAAEAMEALGIDVGDTVGVTFNLEAKSSSYITRHEGWTSVRLIEPMGQLPQPTVLSGRLILGDRVYGRFTQAQLPGQSRPVPICMELFNIKVKSEPGGDSNAVKIWASPDVRAVDHFE
ncbi:serine/threonine protein kinase [Pyxidicoccus trucidator]|uniref:serine/threonine protein kinase n=1 Tax=Pyxidicoccus trucidator TaxID=2709662 RepID=UPI0013DB8794|nr:serine/threonine-protein kinase [Pyxidicoccus trucidator]